MVAMPPLSRALLWPVATPATTMIVMQSSAVTAMTMVSFMVSLLVVVFCLVCGVVGLGVSC